MGRYPRSQGGSRASVCPLGRPRSKKAVSAIWHLPLLLILRSYSVVRVRRPEVGLARIRRCRYRLPDRIPLGMTVEEKVVRPAGMPLIALLVGDVHVGVPVVVYV